MVSVPWGSTLPPGGVVPLLQGTGLLTYSVTFVHAPVMRDGVGFALSVHADFL